MDVSGSKRKDHSNSSGGQGGKFRRGNKGRKWKPEEEKEKERNKWQSNKDLSKRVKQLDAHSSAGNAEVEEGALPHNDLFDKFYQAQKIVDTEEWGAFIQALQTKLPITFRLSSINGFTPSLRSALLEDSFKLRTSENNLEYQSANITPPEPLSWYPGNMAWYLNLGRNDLKRVPALSHFRSWLNEQFAEGNINRQEAVSMIPPLLLDVQPHHRVLDVCAAPGSKTAQLLEALHSGEEALPTGFVIANDADSKRAYMLVHQLKRLGSPCFLVTTHDGQFFPTLYSNQEETSSSSLSSASSADHPILFDRILADVPCSGDGTLRKNVNLWMKWNPSYGLSLHPLQIQIAQRCFNLLRPGGLMVYSTCSFNPVENEAVVAELFRRNKGKMELLDVSDKLIGLHRSPGLTSWLVSDEACKFVERQEIEDHVEKRKKGEETPRTKVRLSMFAPSEEELKFMPLERCMRILPHKQNTGGFFITLIRKNESISTAENEAAAVNDQEKKTEETAKEAQQVTEPVTEDISTVAASPEESPAESPAPSADRIASSSSSSTIVSTNLSTEDPFVPISPSIVSSLIDFFGLSSSLSPSNFFSRSAQAKKCYFVGPGIAGILAAPRNTRLKVVHSGCRAFEKNSQRASTIYGTESCQYRIVQEGIDWIIPHVHKQLLFPSFEQFLFLIKKSSLRLDYFEALLKADETSPKLTDAEKKFLKDLSNVICGCVVLMLDAQEPKLKGKTVKPIAVACWKTNTSISTMITPKEAKALTNLLEGNVLTPIEDVSAAAQSDSTSSTEKTQEEKADE